MDFERQNELELRKKLLVDERKRLYNKKWSKKQIMLYGFGLLGVAIGSVSLFYSSLGVLSFLPVGVYAIGLPFGAVSIDFVKDTKLLDEIKVIDGQLGNLGIKNHDNDERRIPKTNDEIKTEIDRLIKQRDFLKNKKNNIHNKKWSNLQIETYLIGLFGSVTFSFLLADAKTSFLTKVIPFVYSIGVPVTAVSIDLKKEEKLYYEIKNIESEIYNMNLLLDKDNNTNYNNVQSVGLANDKNNILINEKNVNVESLSSGNVIVKKRILSRRYK